MTAPRADAGDAARREAERRGFEPRDLPARFIAYALLGLFLFIGLSAGFVSGVLGSIALLREPARGSRIEAVRQPKPGPRLQITPRDDRTALEATARRRLENYGWVDQAAGRAQIPIDRAMEIVSERGWPDDRQGGAGKP